MIYLDYNSTTPTDPRVIQAMNPYFSSYFGNPSSDHAMGLSAKQAVDLARKEIAKLINAKDDEIIFCSGATEANNLVFHGLVNKSQSDKKHIIVSLVEHHAVLEPIKMLESLGYRITYLQVDSKGVINLDQLKKSLTDDTLLVSVMSANNETGTLQPLEDVGQLTRSKGVFFHTDAAQAIGHVPVDVDRMNIDMLSMSGHKFYGPKGVGVLFVRNRVPRVRLSPMLLGGGQEKELRSGTLNVPAIVGLGEASKIAKKEMAINSQRNLQLTKRLVEGLMEYRDDITINGDFVNRLSHTVNIHIPGVDNKWLMLKMKDFCFSSGSACASMQDVPSHVLLAMGLTNAEIASSFRVGVGSSVKEEDINSFLETIRRLI